MSGLDSLCYCSTCGVVHVTAIVISGLELRSPESRGWSLNPGDEFSGKTCYACGVSQLFVLLRGAPVVPLMPEGNIAK